MDDAVEKQLLIANIKLLRAAISKAKGSPFASDNSDLDGMSVSDLHYVEDGLKDISRALGGLH